MIAILALCMLVGGIAGIVIGVRRVVRQVRPQLAAKRENERLIQEARTLAIEQQMGIDAANANAHGQERGQTVYAGICAFCGQYRVVHLEPFGDHTEIQTCAPCWQTLQDRLSRMTATERELARADEKTEATGGSQDV